MRFLFAISWPPNFIAMRWLTLLNSVHMSHALAPGFRRPVFNNRFAQLGHSSRTRPGLWRVLDRFPSGGDKQNAEPKP